MNRQRFLSSLLALSMTLGGCSARVNVGARNVRLPGQRRAERVEEAEERDPMSHLRELAAHLDFCAHLMQSRSELFNLFL